jgi:regulatory protein
MENTRKRGTQYVLRLLTMKDRTTAELVDKLQKKGFEDDVISSIIIEMKDFGYVDDKKYAMRFAELRATYSKFGPYRIRRELESRGIPKDMAESVVESVFPEGREEANALEIADEWISRRGMDDKEKTARRLYGYLARRGYAPSVVRNTLRRILK